MLIVLVGIIIGLVLGLTGAGGSVFAVPLLMLPLDLPAPQAMGLSLAAVGISALYGVLLRSRSGDIQWLPAAVYAIIGAMFAPLGDWLNDQIDEMLLMSAFSLFVVLIAWHLWRQAKNQPEHTQAVRASAVRNDESTAVICSLNQDRRFTIGLPCLLGMVGGAVITGFLSGLFGVGGGFLIVPILISLTRITMKQAVATSLVIISVISASGLTSYLLSGEEVSMSLMAYLAFGGIAGMTLGVWWSHRLAGVFLQKLLAILMIFMAAVTLIKVFSEGL